ncbi:hypothetical protein SPBR_02358 [Sporothrix brasiliensis 5110]|uniref:Uncharacterized protein n=1 Tax=Sporothrix brasiliensis 5110 TaxID=1398154 RepID=A0A0C2F195_9PEZI|nr:uncharacterized protein SPBR_02358 [Sporothrix brasiliensis 5110]KIH92639.1 hypothetical protein SPBR_02358 [Sporothrix brasiliensis 5110]
MDGSTAKPLDYLQVLDESDRNIFFFILDYVAAYAGQQDQSTLRKSVAALQAWKPIFLAIPPGQATGHRISKSLSANKGTDAPLNGATLLDGRAVDWPTRLKEKSETYYSDTSGPLIRSYYEARQIRAEYGSRDFRSVPPERWSDFPTSIEEQQKLVCKLYDAILNMNGILEKKRPLSLKSSSSDDSGDDGDVDSSTPATSRKRSATERDEDGGNTKDAAEANTPQMKMVSPKKPVPPQKETISVSKVKGLNRIEVEMLSWEILYAIRDIDRGQLPFMNWSGRDWSWDSQFTSFNDRFEAVATTLRRSKAAVCSLLESDYMARLVAHPRREYRRKENNRSQNAERNAQVFVGRHAIGTGQVQVGSSGDLRDRDGNVVAAAGTAHSGLIEQTRKLGEMSRRSHAAKKAKTTAGNATTSLENDTAGEPSGTAAANGSPPLSSQRKPRVRNRKLAAKTETSTTEQSTFGTSESTVADDASQGQGQNSSTNSNMRNNHSSAAFHVDGSFMGGGASSNEFPSVASGFAVLNTNARLNNLNIIGTNTLTLPFRPAAGESNTQLPAAVNNGSRPGSDQDAAAMVSDAPMEDIFSMEVGVTTGVTGRDATVGGHSSNAATNPAIAPSQLTVAEPPMLNPIASPWGTDEHMSLLYQMALYNNSIQNILGANCTPIPNLASSAAISGDSGLDTSMYTIPDDSWAVNYDTDSPELGDDGNSSHKENGRNH